jgi:hypothetical protein
MHKEKEDLKVFRLNRANKDNGICLIIEGELKSESVEIAELACSEALTNYSHVTVLVKNVTEIDADGYAFLKRLIKTKAQVQAIGIFSEYVVKGLQTGVVA